jgi:hypothetical protein
MKGNKPEWWPDWQGKYVAVIGGGASIKRSEVDSLKGRLPVIVINESYQLAAWADVLYSCDHKWWQLRWDAIKDFKGLKVTQDVLAVATYTELNRLRLRSPKPGEYTDHFLMDEYGEIGSGRSSGFQVINWLAQIGVKGIALLGFDACDIDNKIHWHGRHPDQLNNPNQSTYISWKIWLENAAPKLRELNIEVVNCSMQSAIAYFPRHSVEDILARWEI